MKPIRHLLLCLAALCVVGGIASASTSEKGPTREELEAILRTHEAGLREKDFQKLQSTIADVMNAANRNFALSWKQPYPPSLQDEAWKQDLSRMIPFENLSFVTMKKKEDVAFLAYCWEKPVAGKEPVKGTVVVTFVRQKDGWRLLWRHTIENDECASLPPHERKAWFETHGRFADAEAHAEKTNKMPPLVKTPADYVATYLWVSYGGTFVVTVNGLTETVQDNDGMNTVLGGLKKGKNTIRIRFVPGEKSFEAGGLLPRIRFAASAGTPDTLDGQKQLFIHQWKPGEGDFKTTVEVSDEILAGLPKVDEDF